MGGKDHCRVTTGRMKNSAKRLSFGFRNKAKYRIVADSRMIPNLLRMKLQVFLCVCVCVCVCLFVCLFIFSFFFSSPSYSSVPAVHLITAVYITVVRTRECVWMREAGE